MKPELCHEIELVPAFHEVDPMEVVWHGHYAKYLEAARSALLSRFGYDWPGMRESGYAWPIIDMRLKYVKPVRFGQAITVRAQVVEWENRLRIEYLVRDARTGVKLSKATTVQVAVDMRTGEMCYVCPRVLWERLGVSA